MGRRVVQRSFGGPDVLTLVGVDAPTPESLAPDEVLVASATAGINPIDVMTREGGGMAAAGIISLPFTPGWDVAGTVAAAGPAVTQVAVGDRVMGLACFPQEGGAYAEHVVVPADDLVAMPASWSDEQAGAFPMAAMTAWQAFADTTHVAAGQRVLVSGAGGGVGHLAVQLAHHLGAHVIALAGPAKHDWLRDLGADETVDYHDEAEVAALAGTIDVALSLAAGSRQATLDAVRAGGSLIVLGAGADDLEAAATRRGVRFAATHVHTQRDWLLAVADLAERGRLVPTVSAVYDLADAGDAHRELEGGHSTGKIVLRTHP